MRNKNPSSIKKSRRNAIKSILILAGVAVFSTLIFNSFFAKERSAELKKLRITNIKDVPKGTAYTFNGSLLDQNLKEISGPFILIHLHNEEIKAFSAVCTHLGCTTKYSQDTNMIECPCHGGRFNPQTGAVISGPPKRPLPEVNLIVDSNGDVYATGVKIL
ncbi:MAG: Rieske (2Fe-2S) protein [Nitrososphaerales archaeon]